jgi:polyketide biosynthesis enoyl-CoA hydratase PksH
MAHSTILVTTSPQRLTVVLHRPAEHNAINDTMIRELHAALDAAEQAPDCRMFVLQGAPGVFCTGMDLVDSAAEAGGPATRRAEPFFRLLRRFTASPCVIVSVVDGRAEGGGVGLVAASDFVFATERARFGLPEALWGLLPSSVLPFLLRRTGLRTAYAMTLSTLPIDAREAHRTGLVDAVMDDPTRPLQRLTARVMKLEPATILAVKQSFARLAPISEEVEAAALREHDELFASGSFQQAIARFTGPERSFPWER